MLIPALSLCQGKGSNAQHFFCLVTANPVKITLLQDTLTNGITQARRSQIWDDPTNCSQFTCRQNHSFRIFTRPVMSEHVNDADGGQWMVSSFTNTIGQVFLVAVPLNEFDGFFSNLVCRTDAARFNLPV